MAQPNPICYKMSASSIGAFKACPQRFRLAYREGLRPDGETEAQRVGTNWHALHEVYHNALTDSGCHDAAQQAIVNHLDERYAEVPGWTTPQEWDLERQKLLTCFLAYQWYYQNDTITYISNELPFELPIHDLDGKPLPLDKVCRVGKIDHLICWSNMVGVLERKSTTRDIDPSSQYWEKSQKDTQVSNYALAVKDLMNFPNPVSASIYGDYFELPLSQDMVTIVDEKDRELIEQYRWHAWSGDNKTYYAATNIKTDDGYVAKRMHQILMGDTVDNQHIDHINRDSLDNRRCNLRVTTRSVNRLNSDTRGISWHKASEKWVARIMVGGKSKSLGYFDNESDAKQAYEAAKAAILPETQHPVCFGNTLYDVWRRPSTKPKLLTQADTAEFQETKKYFGQEFDFEEVDGIINIVDGQEVESKIGKKGYAIRESNRMYAARLLDELTENPERYFQRKEIARTDAEIAQFRRELFNIYQAQRAFETADCWYENENQCRATFACQYIPICYGSGANAVCNGETTPDGFKRIFVDLTMKESDYE